MQFSGFILLFIIVNQNFNISHSSFFIYERFLWESPKVTLGMRWETKVIKSLQSWYKTHRCAGLSCTVMKVCCIKFQILLLPSFFQADPSIICHRFKMATFTFTFFLSARGNICIAESALEFALRCYTVYIFDNSTIASDMIFNDVILMPSS